MSVGRAVRTVGSFLLGAIVFSIVAGPQVSSAVDGIAAQGLAIVAGAAITAIAAILAMQCWVMDALVRATTSLKVGQLINALGGLDGLTGELKEDVFMLLFLVAVTMLVPIARVMDVPGVVWPFQAPWLSKTMVLNALAVFSVSLSAYTVVDILNAMFAIHRQCTTVLRGHIRLLAENNDSAGCGGASSERV